MDIADPSVPKIVGITKKAGVVPAFLFVLLFGFVLGDGYSARAMTRISTIAPSLTNPATSIAVQAG